ncbi:hypothetical protein [Chryseobacterium luquanense]|uniref:Uncharacterized protein n=1 Tax=Chryseobacterium luquanense TaxID=2983766 RepID=A0ABT3Y4K5_9FLAO|nr:hypothetical protein [Chryseobacterium luquanense]MCX8533073.1 hypothetical protein [Chryseobacterium luquanense]
MKTKPILFSTDMVQANLDGRKTNTRRIIDEKHYGFLEYAFKNKKNLVDWISKNAKYQMEDVLWVRETFQQTIMTKSGNKAFLFKADLDLFDPEIVSWSPSIHMPKEAARMFLKILNVRVERVQDISNEDAIAEGIEYIGDIRDSAIFRNYMRPGKEKQFDYGFPHNSFSSLWEKINGKASWKQNPFVWVYEYQIIEKPENFI